MKNKIDKPLTDMQRKFANLYVENLGANKLTNTQLAINSGYEPESAYQRAYELLNPRICPHVVRYISERKAEFLQKNNIDPNKHLAALQYAKDRADKLDMLGVYLRAEELRGKVAGYYVERSLVKNVEEETAEELEQKLKKILEDHKPFIEEKKNEKK